MLVYSNSFSLSVDDKKNEFILAFKQNCPKLDDQGNVKSVSADTVSEIVLNKDGADALCSLLVKVLGPEPIVD